LGERAYVAQQARNVEISRSRGGATLHSAVCARLGVSAESDQLTWDSYRSADGRWVITAFHAGAVVGTWTYDTTGRTVHPEDQSARALMGAGQAEPATVATDEPIHDPIDSNQEQERVDGPADELADELADESADDVTDEPMPRPRLVSVTSNPTSNPSSQQSPTQAQEALIDKADVPSDRRRAKRAKTKRGRASVPSWDEILFGTSRPED
jgi:hypothetical protein